MTNHLQTKSTTLDEATIIVELQAVLESERRGQLTALDAATSIGALIKLITPDDPPLTLTAFGVHRSAILKAARATHISEARIRAALKIAAIFPTAQKGICDAGLENNRRALMQVASESSAEAQTALVSRFVMSEQRPEIRDALDAIYHATDALYIIGAEEFWEGMKQTQPPEKMGDVMPCIDELICALQGLHAEAPEFN